MRTNKFFLLLSIVCMGIFTSCSSDDDNDVTGATSEEVVEFMKNSLYDVQGVAANKLDDYQEGEYNLVADEESDIYTFFAQLTGIEIEQENAYEYTYKSVDGKCVITIKGTRKANNSIYATIRFSVSECPEIKIIHIGTEAMMQGTNGNDSGKFKHRLPAIKKTMQ